MNGAEWCQPAIFNRVAMIVYKITNLVNGKAYVGQTTQKLKNRWSYHKGPRSRCMAMKAAIDKYGVENFKIEELFVASSKEELNVKEIEFIEIHNTLAPNGYNLKTGGANAVYSEESRKKMSKASKGRIPWNKGLTTEDPRVASYIRYGKDNPAYGNSYRKGAVIPEEQRASQRQKMKGRKLSPEHKQAFVYGPKNKPANFSETMSKVKDSIKIKITCVETGAIYESISHAARSMNINPGGIHGVLTGYLKQTKGFTFKRLD